MPKIDFLRKVLNEELHILDIGAGSGYFVSAARFRDIDACGVEISKYQVEYGNRMMGRELLKCVDGEDVSDILTNTDRNVISAIGVLEHLYNLRDILSVIKGNSKIHYLYFSVPMFSFSVFLESIFSKHIHRQLGFGHTHLFTAQSIEYMNKEFGFEEVGIWQFGQDALDLYRFIKLELIKDNEVLGKCFDEKYLPCMNALQNVLDEKDFCSEIHMVVKIH